MIQKRVQFENTESEILAGEIRIPEEQGKYPAVIVCHSFKGNKDKDLVFNIWDVISRAGFACLKFDFSGHGESAGNFRDFTITQQIKDIKSAFDWLAKQEFTESRRIGIVGVGVGAMASILFTAKHKKPKTLVSISSKTSVEELVNSYFNDYQQKEWREKGYIMFYDFKELGTGLLDDINKHNVLEAVGNVGCPILVIHGTMDSTTPFSDARELFNHAEEPKKLELIDDATHNFAEDSHRDQLLDALIEWLLRTL